MGTPNDNAFLQTIADVTRLTRREFDRRVAPLGLTRAQWRALKRIERAEGLTQAQLADDLEMEPIAIGRVLDRLQAAGFIERRADPHDRRCWRLHLAPRSAAVLADVDRIAGVLRREMLGRIAARELEVAERVLEALKETLLGMENDAQPRPRARVEARTNQRSTLPRLARG
jgi:MarR family transcriptional regulator for hemolysin